jgi:hypothetical protein
MSRAKYNREWAARNRANKRAASKRYTSSEKYKRTRRAYFGIPEPTRPSPEACECCGRRESRALNVDHDHTTGQFRGWLCFACNTGIGKLGDNYDGVLRALRYLEAFK